jgi:transposase
MAGKRDTHEGHSNPDVARRLEITTKSLYNWRTGYGDNARQSMKPTKLKKAS